ncbi:MAG TPA: hypothetical protein VF572_02945 [Candidatus Saccharimonadales bacterium]|jgi:cytoskeletal protein CcmA (bactofilin family)
MDTENKNPEQPKADDNTVIETDSLESPSDGGVHTAPDQQAEASAKQPKAHHKLSHRINIYLLLFILVLVISGGVLVVTAMSQKNAEEPKIASQAVPTDALKQLAKTDATVGDPKQVLNVQSNAVFAGKVLIRDSLDVAGTIRINGSLSLPGITVSGESQFDQVQINRALTIGGDASVQGQMSVKKSLSVTGGGTFGGAITAPQIATSSLQILSDLTLSSHIIAGGPTPGRTPGGALGNGGTASISGSDTAGSINVNTGSSPAAGCFLTVNFTSRYSSTPHVVITATSSAAAGLNYYVNKTTNGFSVCAAAVPPANSSIGFDYIVLG